MTADCRLNQAPPAPSLTATNQGAFCFIPGNMMEGFLGRVSRAIRNVLSELTEDFVGLRLRRFRKFGILENSEYGQGNKIDLNDSKTPRLLHFRDQIDH
jgi:hypothetical protein